jgi:hypothetical protein
MKRKGDSIMKSIPFFVLAAVVCLVLTGCRCSKPIHIYTGLDSSGSARKDIGSYVLLTKSAAEQLQAGQDHATMYRVDTATHEFSDGVYDGNVEQTLRTVVAEVKSAPTKGGTFPALFWQQVKSRVEADTEPTVIFLMSDGDNDDMRAQATQQMREAAKSLSQCKHVRAVVFCGANKENWECLRQTFAPLGNRLHILSSTQLNAESISPFLEETRK